jgi:hypothetical protein
MVSLSDLRRKDPLTLLFLLRRVTLLLEQMFDMIPPWIT